MDTIRVTLHNAAQGHQVLRQAWEAIKPMLTAGRRVRLEVREERRSLDQNARMWAMLTDISKQVDWYGQKLSKEDWKVMLTASLKKQRAVPGIDGGFVILGDSTSNMSKREMAELQDLAGAFGAQHGVRFTAPEV